MNWYGIGSFTNKTLNMTLGENSFDNIDPKFRTDNPTVFSDFSLQSASPMVNTGIAIPIVTEDFFGLLRPQGIAPELGAFEFLEYDN